MHHRPESKDPKITSSIFHLSEEHLKKAKENQHVLYACSSFSDGVGDYTHLFDFYDYHKKIPAFKDHEPFMLLLCSEKFRAKAEDTLRERGYSLPSPHIHIVCPASHLTTYLNGNELLKKQLATTSCLLNISTPDLSIDGKSHGLKAFLHQHHIDFPHINILEHYEPPGIEDSFPHTRDLHMGVEKKEGSGGLKLSRPTPANPADLLMEMKDKTFLATLLNKTVPEKKDCEIFLANSLFIPTYFQQTEKIDIFDQLMKGIATSPLASEFKEIVFQGQTCIDVERYREAMPASIAKLIIQRKEEKPIVIENPRATTSAKTVRVLEGFFLETADYRRALQCAQLFHGVSGDNTFEQAISHGVIPLYELKEWKATFIASFMRYLKSDHPTKESVYLFFDALNKCLTDPGEKSIAALNTVLTPIFKAQWDEVIRDLHENHNIYDKLPEIATTLLKQAKKQQLTRR